MARLRNKNHPKWQKYIDENKNFLVTKSLLENPKWTEKILDVGCGKGQMLIELAKENPSKMFIGIEKEKAIVAKAIRKAKENQIQNLFFILDDVLNLNLWFSYQFFDLIFITFPDPWTKNKTKYKRLVQGEEFAQIWKILKNQKKLILKTDVEIIYQNFLETLQSYKYKLDFLSKNLYNDEKAKQIILENKKTEYEQKKVNLGLPIFYVKILKN